MVLSDDIATFILIAAKRGGIYNLTDGVHPSFFELSSVIAKKFDKNRIYNLPIQFAKLIAWLDAAFKGFNTQ
jgi:hypothetical protein